MRTKRDFLSVIMFLCFMSACMASDPHAAKSYTGYSVAIYQNLAVVGTAFQDSFGGFIQILEKVNDEWKIIQTTDLLPYGERNRSAITLAVYENHLLIGSDAVIGVAGSVLVFNKNTISNIWDYSGKISASNKQGDDLFGFSLALNGDTAFVGAKGRDQLFFKISTGGVYVFKFQKDTQLEDGIIYSPQNIALTRFGESIISKGKYLLISAPGYEDKTKSKDSTSYGAAYLYSKQNSTWKEKVRFHELMETKDIGYEFGEIVNMSIDHVVIANMREIFIFKKTFNEDWIYQSKLENPSNPVKNSYPYRSKIWSVAMSDGIVAVGCYLMDTKQTGEDLVYIYRELQGAWEITDIIHAKDLKNNLSTYFGYSLDLYENNLIIGALGNRPESPDLQPNVPFPGKAHIVKLLPQKGFVLEATVGFEEFTDNNGKVIRKSVVENIQK